MQLARKGYKVLLVDRDTFPSDTLSTHQLQVPGGAFLKRNGLLEELEASGCPPARSTVFDAGFAVVRGRYPGMEGVDAVYSPRRRVLDMILLNAAEKAGAEVRTGFSVQDLEWDGARVAGIKGRSEQGTIVSEQGRVVIGADGMRSMVARAVQASAYNERPTLSFAYYTYWEGVAVKGGEMYGREGCAIGMWPTNDGLVVTFLSMPRSGFGTFHTDVEGNFMKAMERIPELAERLRAGKRVERFYGTGDLPNFFRKPYGPGWALVGDAGYHKDPISGHGMSDAFRSAELLSDALHAGWSGEQVMEEALAGYEQKRNADAMPMYEQTLQSASHLPRPLEQRIFLSALAHDQTQSDRFLGVLTGTVSPTEFFSPRNLFHVLGVGGLAKITLEKLGQRIRPAREAVPQAGG
jgi:2-polyprenyl-6-methoxyphenol hydroxylase-like FAD-dependent oxidoreductase